MAQPSQPLLREVINIPRTMTHESYVLKLTEALGSGAELDKALEAYVLTDKLVDRFGEALAVIESALSSGSSKAAFLHGSFGSGKSHFMAVLAALLGIQEQAALRVRGLEGFAGAMREHGWVRETRCLLLPFHMLDGKSLEQKVLGGYVEHVRRQHPEAPIPQVYRADALLESIRDHRQRMGDEAFIDGLPGGDVQDKWGDASFWTTQKLDAALAAEQTDPEVLNEEDPQWHREPVTPGGMRAKLISDALGTWFKGLFQDTAEDRQAFVSLDRGLGIIAAHAKSLGYDALVLFLDELILWLANHIRDQQFVSEQAAKITNFVEGSDARRAIPVISFIARQRDLRDLVGDEAVMGSAEVSIQDTLSLADDRFRTIRLPDSDLPAIAHERLLKARTDVPDAQARVDTAFANIKRVKPDVWDELLGSSTDITAADEAAFRRAFPFSPAFMDTLVRVAEALSRSRTGLKLMGQMLYDQRDTLPLGQLVPLGDLYEVLYRGGSDPFTQTLREQFRTAQDLYKNQILPYLLSQHDIRDNDLEAYRRDAEAMESELRERVEACITDNRLIGTLLLSALVPSVPAFQNLTVKRLTALNHGVITSRVRGFEAKEVAKKVKEWANAFPEIKYTEGPDAGVTLELIGVDYESVITRAQTNNNPNNRRALVKRLLWEELGVTEGQLDDQLNLVWRGSRRSLEVHFGNLADPNTLTDDQVTPRQPGIWRLIVDVPFDDVYGDAESRDRIMRCKNKPDHDEIRTVAWVPAHFTRDMYDKFQRLVIVDFILNGQRFESYAGHLSPNDRERAKDALRNHHRSLTSTVREALRQAYGVAPKNPEKVGAGEDHVLTVPDMTPITLEYNAPLYDAARHIASCVLAHQYPAHPDLDPQREGFSVRSADVRTVFGYLRAASDEGVDTIEVKPKDRPLMTRLAGEAGLKLGTMHEARFQVGRHWEEHFGQKAGTRYEDKPIPVRDLLDWIDEPVPHGLDPMLANLVLCAYAERTDRVWTHHGGPVGAIDPAGLKPAYQLRAPERPDEETWHEALARAGDLCAVAPISQMRRARIIAEFSDRVRQQAGVLYRHAGPLVDALEQHASDLGLDPDSDEGRLATARRAAALAKDLTEADPHNPLAVINVLVGADVGDRAGQQRIGTSLASAKDVVEALTGTPWDTVYTFAQEAREPYATEIRVELDSLHGVARAEELTAQLKPALAKATRELTRIVRKANAAAPAPTPTSTGTAHSGTSAEDSRTAVVPAPNRFPPAPAAQTQDAPSGAAPVPAGQFEVDSVDAAGRLGAELSQTADVAPRTRIRVVWQVVEQP
ncbi:phage resistance protein [Streptomyces sp. WMMB303]|uniref:phage resistance protein n=1 Tax=Streptomyces sp. WMMB303 TaxID=3034154 RepID=UPI0023EB9329|nr:phage resistance protein [Streptomyces sp. WMMB303]MDF4251126.1 phage resistance protein [Streptomyces sp. WMMB303]